MSVIQVDIDDQLVQTIGLKAIKEFMDNKIAALKIELLGDSISEIVALSEFDHSKEVEIARQEAWEEYKQKYIVSL
ncbi:MAG: hypothetical protein HQK64_02485 [Desulfamplus sp.]|nr:hypothetical protein [Desulfamplus sp.]MBF0241329.1 hypothetical protein [Desulfamplus sp.]MBF0389316.1 hypothetical protein [Desulfamplus sp.]